jgi:hypothetical protein
MSRVCTICSHEQSDAIDRALVLGLPNRRIAAQHGTTEQAVRRHKDKHLPTLLAESQRHVRADTLMARLEHYTHSAHSIRTKAEKAGDLRTALAAIRELVRIVELQERLIGEIKDTAATVNVLVAPEWLQVRAALLEILQPFPEVRTLVAGELVRLEAAA